MKAGLIGKGISGSLTPGMHEAEARALGFDYRYERIDASLPPHEGRPLAELIDRAEAEGFAGLNITYPFKPEATRLVDTLSDTARALGAVNTVVFRDGKRFGHNTDYTGFRSALHRDLGGAALGRVLLLGAGGAGAAVALALIDQGVRDLWVFDLNEASAIALCERIKAMRPTALIAVAPRPQDSDLNSLDGVVNATPLGMASNPGMAIDPMRLMPRTWVADIVYFPLETALLARARARGCTVMTGATMAVFQAITAFELITGHRPDANRMRQTFLELSGAKDARKHG